MCQPDLPQPAASQFARYIESQQAIILLEWRTQVSHDDRIPSTQSVPPQELIDHLPKILGELCKYLRQDMPPEASNKLELNADIHGTLGWMQGYTFKTLLLAIEELRKVLAIDLMHEFVKKQPKIDEAILRKIEHLTYDFFRELIVCSAQNYVKAHFEELLAHRENLFQANKKLDFANKKLREEKSRILELTRKDPLTRIANRRYLATQLHKEIERCNRYNRILTVVMLDIDHFKSINDQYGHYIGDKVLKYIASLLESLSRTIDFVSRYGGEEFVLLLPDTPINDAIKLVDRIRTTIAESIIDPLNNQVTASFGLAQWAKGETPSDLIERADKALYQAKNAGRNCLRVNNKCQVIALKYKYNKNNMRTNTD